VGDKRKDTKWTFMLSEKRVNGGNRRQKDRKGGVQKGTCDHGGGRRVSRALDDRLAVKGDSEASRPDCSWMCEYCVVRNSMLVL
jgi:hypothetical protein